jgi:hypothetical protein
MFPQCVEERDASLFSFAAAPDLHLSEALNRDFPGRVAHRFIRVEHRNLLAVTNNQQQQQHQQQQQQQQHEESVVYQFYDKNFLKAFYARIQSKEGTIDEIIDQECAANNNRFVADCIEFCQ